MTDNENQLVARLRQGDREALAELITVCRDRLLAYIQSQLGRRLRRKVEAEDILQDTSTEAVRTLGEVDLTAWDPFGWLCQIAQRRVVDAHRRFFGAQKRDAAREVPLEGGDAGTRRADLVNRLVSTMTTASQAFSRNQRELRLWEALGKLPPEHQEALRLRYVENLPSKQIADRLGKTDGAVRVMLTRSLARLQELLSSQAED